MEGVLESRITNYGDIFQTSVNVDKKWRSKERLDAPSKCKCPVNVL